MANVVAKDQTPAAEGAKATTVEEVEEEIKTNGKDAQLMTKKEEVEPKTGVPFPVKLNDGKQQLLSVGLRKKSMLGLGIKIYAFGIYADIDKLNHLLNLKIGKAPPKPTKEMYQAVIDSDSPMLVRLVIVFSSLTMNMVKKNFDEGLGASMKKLTTGGKKNDELANKVMGQASDEIKLTSGSVIEISRLPGYVLQTKVMDEVVSKVESELLCRAYIHMYLGDDPFDKDAKENFGMSLLSLF
ncbi:chalcone isomerase-like protein 1 [Euphorbia lathyris]|uniref:chalcone isomerase-like protein 1 n=1 Tax=Euphorbia lathyris TaxID=212925 RepID=UPI003313F0A6